MILCMCFAIFAGEWSQSLKAFAPHARFLLVFFMLSSLFSTFLHFSTLSRKMTKNKKSEEKLLHNQDFFPCAICVCVCTKRLRWHVNRNFCFVAAFLQFSPLLFIFLTFLHFSSCRIVEKNEKKGKEWKKSGYKTKISFHVPSVCVCIRRLRWHVDRNLCFVVIFLHFSSLFFIFFMFLHFSLLFFIFLIFSWLFLIFLHFSSFSSLFFMFLHFSSFSSLFFNFSTFQHCGDKWRKLATKPRFLSMCHLCVCVCIRRLRWHVDRNRCFVVHYSSFFFTFHYFSSIFFVFLRVCSFSSCFFFFTFLHFF